MAFEMDVDNSPVVNNRIPHEVLEDLCSRFLINIPDEERKDVVRLCFQIELAHWFYIDFYRQEQSDLPGCGIKEFTRIIFNNFPFLNETGEDTNQIFANWRKYKLKVPVFGAIVINETLDKCLLVQPAMSKTSWGFPKGKVNKDEEEFECAIREVYEETGFDMRSYAHPDDYIEHKIHDHPIRLYVAPGVPEHTQFQPQTRGEIRDIRWFEIEYLPVHKKDANCTENLNCNPNSFFMVIPFVKDLRRRLSSGKTPRSGSQNNRLNRKENDSPIKMQLQKLVEKEEARLESEKKQASAERRRKLQQEKFLAQHALSHPLRDHHQREQDRLRTARGYLSPSNDPDTRYSRSSPVLKERDGKRSPSIRILQRSDRSSSPQERKTAQKTRDYKSTSLHGSVEQQEYNQLQNMLQSRADTGINSNPPTYAPFSPIHQAPAMAPFGTTPSHPTTRYSYSYNTNLSLEQNQAGVTNDHSLDPLTKLRLLSASASAQQIKTKPAVQESCLGDETKFMFNASAFENFKFDREAILSTLDVPR